MMCDVPVLTLVFRLGWRIWPEQGSTLLSPRSKRVISYPSGESGHKQLSSMITLSCRDTYMWPLAVLIYRKHCIGRSGPAPLPIMPGEMEASLYSNTKSMYSPWLKGLQLHRLFLFDSLNLARMSNYNSVFFFDCCCAEDVLKLRQCSVSVMS